EGVFSLSTRRPIPATHGSGSEPVHAAVFGNLLFNAATAAVANGSAGRAVDMLAEARSAAARIRTSIVSEAALFSTRAVAFHEVEHLTRTGESEAALRRAAELGTTPGRLPAFQEAGHELQLAAASVATRRYDDALTHLEAAHRLAPYWAAAQPLGRVTMRTLLDRATRRRGPRFAALAQAYRA
ncbi:hypothetical protein, partial [Myceligenerans halotolerans]